MEILIRMGSVLRIDYGRNSGIVFIYGECRRRIMIKASQKERIGDIGRAKLENIGHPILKKTAECMKEKRLAGYQENMLKELLEDMQN